MSRIRLAVAPLVLLFPALFPAPSPLQAQTPRLLPGMRVRLPAVGEATIVQRSGDTLYLVLKDGISVVQPLRDLRRIDVRGDKDHGAGAKRGAIIGGGIGLVGGVIGWAVGDSTGCKLDYSTMEEYDCQRTMNAVDAAMAAGGSALLGAGIGALIGRRSWHALYLQGAEVSRVGILPGRRLAFSVTLRPRRR